MVHRLDAECLRIKISIDVAHSLFSVRHEHVTKRVVNELNMILYPSVNSWKRLGKIWWTK